VPRPLRLGSYLENIGRSAEAAYFSDLCFLKPAAVQRVMGRTAGKALWDSAVYEAVTTPYRRCPSKDAVQCAQYADLMVYLPNDVLIKVDRMSMQHGLEVRSPLLDRRMIELAFRIPERLKRAGQRGKHLLRQIAAARLPPAVVSAAKHGFSAPIGQWIAGPYREAYEAEVLSSASNVASLLDIAEARRLFRAHVAGSADHSFALWALWVLDRWCGQQVTASRPAALCGVRT
jgi:asparagine synthase (glutamine-hydrolysing)